jgi:hypothetical protein
MQDGGFVMADRSKDFRRYVLGAALATAVLLPCRALLADADAAKKYVKDAQTAFDGNDAKTAGDDLALAEAELDGLPDNVKTPIAADIKALRDKINGAANADAKNAAVKNLDELMDEAKKAFDAPQTFEENDKAITDFLSNDDNKKLLGDETVAKYLKTLSTYRKVAHARAIEVYIANAKDRLDNAEKEWPEKKTALAAVENDVENQPDAQNFSHHLEEIAALLGGIPKDNAQFKPLSDRYNKLNADFTAVLYKSKAGETFSRIKDNWESYADEYSGWDAETKAPTFDDLLHKQGDTASKLFSPKSVGLVSRATYELDNWMKDDVIHSLYGSDDKIKAYINKVAADRKAAMDKLAGFASSVIAEAEKANINADARDRLETLANDDLTYCLAGSDQLKTLQDRALKIVHAFDAKVNGDAAAHQKLFDDLTAAGTKAWPAMAAKVQASDEFDANAIMQNPDNFKDKLYHFKGVNNRMGWDYSPGNGYQFAMTADGTPVAAKFDTTVKASVKDVAKRTAKDLPDENWEFIAAVEDVGPIVKIDRATGDIKTTGGETVGTVTAQADVTVKGVRLKIVALHAGPVTAAEDQGVVNADGSIGQPAQ